MLKAPYYLHAPPYVATSAGIRVIYKLAHALNTAGQEAWIVMEPYMPDAYRVPDGMNAPVITKDVVDLHRAEGRPPIAVYPEVVIGNPIGASAVVRYVMNEPGLLGGPKKFPGELLFAYGAVLADQLGLPDRNLFLPAIDLDDYPEPPAGPRTLQLAYVAKYRTMHGSEPFGLPSSAVEITRDLATSPDPATLRGLLRKADILFLYENSALAIEAPLSGCVAVMMPNPHLSYPIGARDHGMGGIAWGAEPHQIARARATLGEMRSGYQAAINRFPGQLERFIQITQDFGRRDRPFLANKNALKLPSYTYDMAASDAASRLLRSGRWREMPKKVLSVARQHGALAILKIVVRFTLLSVRRHMTPR